MSKHTELTFVCHENGIDIIGIALSVPRTVNININDIFNVIKESDDIFEGKRVYTYGTDNIYIIIWNEHLLPIDYIKKIVLKDVKSKCRILTSDNSRYILQKVFLDTFSYVLYVSKKLFVYDEVANLSSKLSNHKDQLKSVAIIVRKFKYKISTDKATIESLEKNIENKNDKIKELTNELKLVKKITVPISSNNEISEYLSIISNRFPHLSLRECLNLINKCIFNGGKISVHNGEFKETNVNDYIVMSGSGCNRDSYGFGQQLNTMYKWSCCPTIDFSLQYSKSGDHSSYPSYTYISFRTTTDYLILDKFKIKDLSGDNRNPFKYKLSDIVSDFSLPGTPFTITYKKIIEGLKSKDCSIEGKMNTYYIARKNTNNINDKEFNEYVRHYGSRDPSSICLNSEILDLDLSELKENIYETSQEKELTATKNKLEKQISDLSKKMDELVTQNAKLKIKEEELQKIKSTLKDVL